MLESTLREIGFTENEVKVYIALLDLGEATASQIVDKADIRTGRVYDVFNSLRNKGVIAQITRNKKKIFSPADPQKILDLLQKKQRQLHKQEKEVRDILPEITAKINALKPETKIEIYTGFEGMRTAYKKEVELYDQDAEVLVLGVQDPSAYDKKTMDFFSHNVSARRERMKVKVRKINNQMNSTLRHEPSAEIRHLDYPSMTILNICKNLTIIGLFGTKGIYITIEDQEVADDFRTQFEFLWKIATPSKNLRNNSAQKP